VYDHEVITMAGELIGSGKLCFIC